MNSGRQSGRGSRLSRLWSRLALSRRDASSAPSLPENGSALSTAFYPRNGSSRHNTTTGHGETWSDLADDTRFLPPPYDPSDIDKMVPTAVPERGSYLSPPPYWTAGHLESNLSHVTREFRGVLRATSAMQTDAANLASIGSHPPGMIQRDLDITQGRASENPRATREAFEYASAMEAEMLRLSRVSDYLESEFTDRRDLANRKDDSQHGGTSNERADVRRLSTIFPSSSLRHHSSNPQYPARSRNDPVGFLYNSAFANNTDNNREYPWESRHRGPEPSDGLTTQNIISAMSGVALFMAMQEEEEVGPEMLFTTLNATGLLLQLESSLREASVGTFRDNTQPGPSTHPSQSRSRRRSPPWRINP